MFEGERRKKRIHMLEYITFSQGKSKTRTSADIYSPLVANLQGTWMSDREGMKWFMQNFLNHLWKSCPTADHEHSLCWHQTRFSVTDLNKRYLIPNNRSHEWMGKTTAAEQNKWIEVIESYHQREILSFEYCTHYNGPEELCAVKSYALVKLNKGKVFPHEGQMRISK